MVHFPRVHASAEVEKFANKVMGKKFLEEHTVADVFSEIADENERGTRAGPGGVEANIRSTAGDVLDLMSLNDVTLVSIYEDEPNNGKVYRGIVDVFDLIGYVALESEHTSKAESLSSEFLDHSLRSVFETGGKPGSKLQLRPAKMVKPSDSLYTAVTLLIASPVRHRLFVSESGSLESARKTSLVRVLTPDMVLQYLYTHLDLLSNDITERPVRNGIMNRVISARPDDDFVKIHHSKPYSINMNATALLAFKSMWTHKIGALGIVDDNHSLVEVISSTDLRNISKEHLPDLHSPAIAFLRHEDRRRPSEPLTCLSITTLAHAMARLIRTRCHRLFVVDDANRPLGVVSVSDVLSAFLE